MSQFEEVRARIREEFVEKPLVLIDVMASSVMARCYGMVLHARVNDATMQANSGRISRTKSFGVAIDVCRLYVLLRKKRPALWEETGERLRLREQVHFDDARNAKVGLAVFLYSEYVERRSIARKCSASYDEMTESVIAAVCKGEFSQKALVAFLYPAPGFIQLKVIEAYRRAIHDDGSAPTLTEVRIKFLEENKKACLPKGYSLRKMLTKTFGLPLSKAKLGRPKTRNRNR